MLKFSRGCFKTSKHFYSSSKWSIPKELLSTSISTAENNNGRSTAMKKLLRKKFPKAADITVTDLTGNCGSMYEVVVVSEEFRNLPLVKQHMLVTEVLKEYIKNMHGITIETKIPEKNYVPS